MKVCFYHEQFKKLMLTAITSILNLPIYVNLNEEGKQNPEKKSNTQIKTL